MLSDRIREARVQAPLPTQTQAGVRVPSVLRCGTMIFATKTALRIHGFAGVIAWIRDRVASVPITRSVDARAVTTTESAVATAAAFYPGRARCLEQSLVLYYLLRRQGIPVRYCHGVQPHPFLAHAWVEYDGVPINDIAEHVRQFARLPDLLP
jgi:hypothetical protein